MIVYLITDAVTGKRYVGQTTVGVERRLASHLGQARAGRTSMRLLVAMREHGADAFSIQELERCTSQEALNRAERYWIERLGTLTPDGYNGSLGIWRRPEQAARTSATMKGRAITWGPKIAATMRGHTSTPAQREALTAGRAAWSTREEFAQRRSATNGRRVLSDGQVREVRAAYAGGEAQQAIADRLHVSQTTISRAIRGVRFGWL